MTEQERYMTTTPFKVIYDRFFGKITDDMYMEWTEADTHADLQNILLSVIPRFEFPKFKLFDYDSEFDVTDKDGNVISQGHFNFGLEPDEIEIFADLMLIEWVRRQMASIEVTRMRYSTSDFRQTSQANHLDKLTKMMKEFQIGNRHLQKVYGRRRVDSDGYIKPNFGGLGGSGNGN